MECSSLPKKNETPSTDDLLRQRFHELNAEVAAIEAVSTPLREQRDAIEAQYVPKVNALNDQITAAEADRRTGLAAVGRIRNHDNALAIRGREWIVAERAGGLDRRDVVLRERAIVDVELLRRARRDHRHQHPNRPSRRTRRSRIRAATP